MRLSDLLNESLHYALGMLKDDAEQLANGERDYIGVIELKDDWEEDIPRLAYRYEKEVTKVYNSFSDPQEKDEIAWIDAHFKLTMDFLIKHGLARQVK